MKRNRRSRTAVLVAGIALCCIGYPAVYGQTGSDNTRGRAAEEASTVPPAGGDFVRQAMEINQAERVLSELARQRASSAAVQAYARQMIEDHKQAAADLAAIRPEPPAGSKAGDFTPSGNTATKNVDARTDTTGSESGMGVRASPAVGSAIGRTDNVGDTGPGMGSDAYKDYGYLPERYQVTINRLKGLSGVAYDREYMSAQVKHHQEAIQLFEREAGNGDNTRLRQYAQQHLSVLRQHLSAANRIKQSLAGGINDGR
ncbi:MAG: DUF4142 domain-containing protein [Cytophagales bacterium]|nr:DUF4142 domain-containing protein [Cytophagales bacterium]